MDQEILGILNDLIIIVDLLAHAQPAGGPAMRIEALKIRLGLALAEAAKTAAPPPPAADSKLTPAKVATK